jgi:hypothetical protein
VFRWARVLAFEPPYRFVISWDISPTWQLVDDPSHASEVESHLCLRARIEPESSWSTGHLERHGEGWRAVRDSVGDQGGWPFYVQRYVDAVAARHIKGLDG